MATLVHNRTAREAAPAPAPARAVTHAVVVPFDSGHTVDNIYDNSLDAAGCVEAYAGRGQAAFVAQFTPALERIRAADVWLVLNRRLRTLTPHPTLYEARLAAEQRGDSVITHALTETTPVNRGVVQFASA